MARIFWIISLQEFLFLINKSINKSLFYLDLCDFQINLLRHI